MGSEVQLTGIAHVIQLAVAPVFLLTGVGTIIGVLSNRLARIIDRSRALEDLAPRLQGDQLVLRREELGVLARRMRVIYLAIGLAVISALAVGLLIALAFVDAFLTINLAKLIATLFVSAMVAFIASLIAFLREIFLAVTTARLAMVPPEGGRDEQKA